MGKVSNLFFSLALLAMILGVLLPMYSLPVHAGSIYDLQAREEEVEDLDYGETRVSPYATVTKTRTYYVGDQLMQECRLEVSSLPQTLPDLETR